MTDIQRFFAPGPWVTRDLKECVLASDYGALAAENAALREAAGKALRLLDYADDSDHCQYGTISTGAVRELLADLRALLGEKP